MWRPENWKNPFKRKSLDVYIRIATLENGSCMKEMSRL